MKRERAGCQPLPYWACPLVARRSQEEGYAQRPWIGQERVVPHPAVAYRSRRRLPTSPSVATFAGGGRIASPSCPCRHRFDGGWEPEPPAWLRGLYRSAGRHLAANQQGTLKISACG